MTVATLSPDHRAQPAIRPRAVVALVCVGIFMTTLDTSIVNIGLPSIARAFGAPLTGTIEWVIIGYLVSVAALLLTFGRLSDMVGRTPIWTAGLVLFTLGSVICGAAPSLALLIAARAVQGAGAALILTTSTAILADVVPQNERGRALGWSAAAISVGFSAGPTAGGLLTEYLSWRWIFYVNVPIGIGALVATLRLLPRSQARQAGRFDPVGAVLLGVGIAVVCLALSFGARWGWSSPRLLGCLAFGCAALAGALVTERRVTDPIVDLRLFRDPSLGPALVSLILSMMAIFAVNFLMPFYFEELRGFSTAQSGLLLTPFSLSIAIFSPIMGSLADRYGSRWLAPLGLVIAAVGLMLLARLDATTPIWDVAWRLSLIGIGQAVFVSPNIRTVMDAAPRAERGEASGLLATARTTGQALSISVAGAVFTSLGGAAAGSSLVADRADGTLLGIRALGLDATFVHAMQSALLLCAAFAAAGALLSLARSGATRNARPVASGALAALISVESATSWGPHPSVDRTSRQHAPERHPVAAAHTARDSFAPDRRVAFTRMMTAMDRESSGDPDADLAAQMVAHHQVRDRDGPTGAPLRPASAAPAHGAGDHRHPATGDHRAAAGHRTTDATSRGALGGGSLT